MKQLIPSLALFLIGCQIPGGNPAIKPIEATGDALSQSKAYVSSATGAIDTAAPHADAFGQAALTVATADLSHASTSMTSASTDLAAVQAATVKMQAANDVLQQQVTALTNSWGHKTQVWVTWAFWIIIGLAAVHGLGTVLGIVGVGTPWGTVASMTAKIVNPAGWATWALSHVEKTNAVASATATPVVTAPAKG